MFGSIRTLRMALAERFTGCWCPAVNETEITFRALPWQVRDGWLRRRTIVAMARAAGRNWIGAAGPRASCRACAHQSVDEMRIAAGVRALERLRVRTRLAGYEGGAWLLEHRIERQDGREIALLTSRVALPQEAWWAAFPPYAARADL